MMRRLMRNEDTICVVLTDNTDKLYYQGSKTQFLLHIFDVWKSCKAKTDSVEVISFIIELLKMALVL